MYIKKLDFSKHTSIKVGGLIDVKIIENIEDLKNLDNYKIIGGGNNLLVSEDSKTNFIMLSNNFNYIYKDNDILKVGGATPNGKIFNFSKQNNITGFEFLQHIPSKLGGLIKMNAGMKSYEIANITKSVLLYKNGKKNRADLEFKYRYSNINDIILEAEFEIKNGFSEELVNNFKNMRNNQPKEPSAGSLFKNPIGFSAGKLLDEVGLKGFRIGDMALSEIHANFLVNLGRGKFSDAIKIVELAENRVFEKFNIKLQKEVCIIY